MPKILLVEDNELNRDMLSRRLQRRGFEIVTATDGEKGVALAASEKPDLILMDIQLPEISGLEVTRRLRGDARSRHIPIIAVTAFAMGWHEGEALSSGCDAYISKPISIFAFLSTVGTSFRNFPTRSSASSPTSETPVRDDLPRGG